MERGRIPWRHAVLAALLLAATVLSFFSFVRENRARILGQNQEYAQDAALQTASRVDDMLVARLTSLDLMSIAVAGKITQPQVDQELLTLLQETSVFDYVEFIDADGLNHNADGATSDATDRENYLEGIRGESGYHVIFNSRITHETLVNFYAPVIYQGEVIGVLNGMFREETLRQAIAIQFFGVDAPSLICLGDGTVVSSCGWDAPPENLLDSLAGAPEETLSAVRDALSRHEALYCTMDGSVGETNVSLLPVGEDWTLVQALPSTVSREMEANANAAGIKLELRLIALFLVCAAYLTAVSLRKRRRLTSEKARLGSIVEALVPLFARLVVVETERGGYEYLKGAPSGLPARGRVEDLERFMSERYLCDGKDRSFSLSRDLERIRAALGPEVPYLQCEYRIRWDEERWENVSALSLRQKDGAPVSLIFAIQDITALQRQKDAVQQTLRDAFRTAEDLSRAKSDFLARMSHDLRTPMNAVLGMASIALSHLDDSGRVQDCLEKINASGHRLLRLINELLDMSKIESGGIVLDEERFDLADKLREVLDQARTAAGEKGLRLDEDLVPFDHRQARGDPERLEQALWHLLDNAVKYTPPGGTVTFRARELPSRAPSSGYYEFVVEDTGAGIDPALQPRIFEPFARGESDQSESGAGLGLPIAQTIVRLMNGEIRMESEPGRGSRFTVRLFLKWEDSAAPGPAAAKEGTGPAVPEETAKPADARSAPKSVTRHAGVRVLLAEDNELNREIALDLLEQAGVRVETAENGAEAVELARKNPPSYYDLIFMDLQMPVMDGCEAVRAIRASGREDLARIPIVAVSANAFQEDVSRARDAGMNDLVMKPVDLDKLLAALDLWLPGG